MMPRVSAGMRVLSRRASDTVLVENPVFAAMSLRRTTPLPKPSPTFSARARSGARLAQTSAPALLHQDALGAQPLNRVVLEAVRRHLHELDAVAVGILEPGLPVAVDRRLERQQQA